MPADISMQAWIAALNASMMVVMALSITLLAWSMRQNRRRLEILQRFLTAANNENLHLLTKILAFRMTGLEDRPSEIHQEVQRIHDLLDITLGEERSADD